MGEEQQDQQVANITKEGFVIRDPEVLAKAGLGEGMWCYATVEDQKADSDHDIIRVDGIDYGDRHNPEKGVHLPIIAQHQHVLPSGEPPVVGRVEEFRKVQTPDGKKALAFRPSWAPTELGQMHKALYEHGYMSGFSIGGVGIEREPIKGGGIDYKKTRLHEISATWIPANVRSTVIRSVQDDQILDQLKKIEEQLVNSQQEVSKSLAGVQERLDNIESAMIAKSEPPMTGERNKGTHPQLSQIAKQLEALKSMTARNN